MDDYIAPDGEPIPTRLEILAARGLITVNRRLGREIPDWVFRDAEWPLEDAAPYPKDRSAS